MKCCLCAVSDLFRVNLRSVYRNSTVTYEALVKLSSKNLCKASPFVGKQERFKCSVRLVWSRTSGFHPGDHGFKSRTAYNE